MKDAGRTGKPGNVAGKKANIGIAMKNPNAHLKLQKKK